VLFGKEKEIEELQKYIDTLNSKANIFIKSKIPQKELMQLYRTSRALIIPLDPNNIADKARFSQKIAEYLSCARPIITNNVGEIPYYLQDRKDALIVDYSVEEFTGAMKYVFDNEEDAEKHKESLTLKADDLISTYAKEMVEYIQKIFKKVGFAKNPKQFIANAYQIKHPNILTWSSLNCQKLILSNGCTLNLESVTDTDLLFNIILDIKNRHYFVLSEDYDSHKKFNSLSIYELSTAVEEFMLKLKGYFVC
jgi:hypothetical protein